MRILKTIGIILAAIIAIFLIVAAIAPKDLNVERSTTIDASAEAIFPHVKYFEKRNAWYPWGQDDPTNKTTIEGEDGTVGAMSKWEGETTGKGHQTITALEENKNVETDLIFTEPYESEAKTYLTLQPGENGTEVTWGLKSKMPYPMNIMLLFGNMTEVLAKDYDNGLSMLKDIVEEEAANAPAGTTYEIQEVELPERYFLAIREEINMDKLTERYAENLPAVFQACEKNKVETTGMPCGLFYSWDEETGTTDVAHCAPIAKKVSLEGYECITLPAGKVLIVDYYGPYEGSVAAHEAITKYCEEKGVEPKMPVIEQYITDPGAEPDPSKWLTKIYYQI
jgi:effector-binding domain-containing protein